MSIRPAAGIAFPVEASVVIVGGGACGLTAALAAHDAGAAPLVLEQSSACLGSSSMSLGAACAAGTAEQKRHGSADDADTFYKDIMAKTHGSADPVLARVMADESGPALDWLAERHDVVFGFEAGWGAGFGHSCARMHSTPGRAGSDMMARLVAACDRSGVDIINDAKVTDLFADPDGRVRGVQILRPDGATETIGCGALILATCGFGGNHAMIAKNIPAMKDARYFGWEGNQGDAILWGQDLGAALANMNAYQGLGLLADPQGIDVNPKFLLEGGVQVNTLGERFSHEVDDVSGQGARVIAQPGGVSWVIYDERIHQVCANLPQYVALLDLNGRRSGASLADLAERIALPVETLKQEFDAINAAIVSGEADRFGRRFPGPALAAPFHALKVTGAVFHTLGGVVVDREARVKRPDGSGLPNLFAGGGAARGFSGDGPSGYLPGAGLCAAITLGRVAGKAAAAQIAGD